MVLHMNRSIIKDIRKAVSSSTSMKELPNYILHFASEEESIGVAEAYFAELLVICNEMFDVYSDFIQPQLNFSTYQSNNLYEQSMFFEKIARAYPFHNQYVGIQCVSFRNTDMSYSDAKKMIDFMDGSGCLYTKFILVNPPEILEKLLDGKETFLNIYYKCKENTIHKIGF